MEEMASEWHIAKALEAVTACCSNFVGKAGRPNVTMLVVSLLALAEVVFETITLVEALKRKDLLPTGINQTVLRVPTDRNGTVHGVPTDRNQTVHGVPTDRNQTVHGVPTDRNGTVLGVPTDINQTVLRMSTDRNQTVLKVPIEIKWPVLRDDHRCSAPFNDYEYSFRGYVALYILGTLAEIVYFTVWIKVFYRKHSTPTGFHWVQIFIAIALEMPLVISSWCMLQELPGNVNYDDIFWDMILLVTFLVNAFLGMCFKLWDILSGTQEENGWNFLFVIVKPVIIIILSCFHTIFLFTPIVMATDNFTGIAHGKDTQNLMEIIRYVGQHWLIHLFFRITALFYGICCFSTCRAFCYISCFLVKEKIHV